MRTMTIRYYFFFRNQKITLQASDLFTQDIDIITERKDGTTAAPPT